MPRGQFRRIPAQRCQGEAAGAACGHMHSSGGNSGAVSQSAACSKRKFSLHSGSARTKMAAHLTHVFARAPHPEPCRLRLSKELSKLQLEKRERVCTTVRTYVRSSFLRFPAISAENSHCEKAKSSTAAAQPFLPDCKKVFHLISSSVCVCVCIYVCACLSCCTKHFSALWIWSGQVQGSDANVAADSGFLGSCGRFLLIAGQLEMFELLEDYCRICPCRWPVKNLSFALAAIISGWLRAAHRRNTPPHLWPTLPTLFVFHAKRPSRKLQLQRKSNFWPEKRQTFHWRFPLLHISPAEQLSRRKTDKRKHGKKESGNQKNARENLRGNNWKLH